METVLGLIGVFLFIVSILSLSAGVTYAVVKLTPQKRKPAQPAE